MIGELRSSWSDHIEYEVSFRRLRFKLSLLWIRFVTRLNISFKYCSTIFDRLFYEEGTCELLSGWYHAWYLKVSGSIPSITLIAQGPGELTLRLMWLIFKMTSIYLFTFQGNFSAYHSVLRINRVSDCCESQSVDSCVAREIDHSVQPNLCVNSVMRISVL